MILLAQTQYLAFFDTTPPERKTKVVTVTSIKNDYFLGEIKWYGAWRQYAFFPAEKTIWNRDCLEQINERIAVLMAARRRTS